MDFRVPGLDDEKQFEFMSQNVEAGQACIER